MDKHRNSDSEWTNRSSELLEKDKYQEALEAAEEALKSRPEYAPAWVIKARALNALNRPEEGLAACDQANEYDRNLFDAYYYKGLILEGQERWQEALTEYDHALRINSTSMDALVQKGGVLVQLKDEEAPILPIANRMIQLNPNDPRGWSVKAMALCMRKEYREAEEVINHALTLDSDDMGVRALTLKAMICEETGRQSEARKLLKRAAKLDPKNEFVQEVKGEMGLSQYDQSHKPTVAEAKRSLIICWVFTALVGLIFGAPLISTLSEGSIPFLFALPLGLYSAWSLYWGWGPMWWRWNPFRDSGNAFGGIERDAESRDLKRAIISPGTYSPADKWFDSFFGKVLYFVMMSGLFLFIAAIYGAFKGIARYQFHRQIAGGNITALDSFPWRRAMGVVSVAAAAMAVGGYFMSEKSDANKAQNTIGTTPMGTARTEVAALSKPAAPVTPAPSADTVVTDPRAIINLRQQQESIQEGDVTEVFSLAEEKLSEVKRRAEESPPLKRGDRKKARKANDRGLTYLQSGQVSEAISAFHEAHQADPSDVEIVNNLGYAYLLNNDLDSAERYVLTALTMQSGRSAGWGNLGQIYAKEGQIPAAVASFINAYQFSRDPNQTHSYFLGMMEKENDVSLRQALRQATQVGERKFLSAGANLDIMPPQDLSVREAEALKMRQEATKREEADAKAIGLDVGVEGTPYWIGERTMAITFRITNSSNAPIDLAEIESGGYRFLNPIVLEDQSGYPKSMLAEDGLSVEDERPIAPGETRKIKIMVTNTKWETEKLSSLFGQDNRFTGQLRFTNNVGKSY